MYPDVSLWLTDGMNGGAGGDWGERIGTDYFLGAIKQDSVHILLHEIGHGFGLDGESISLPFLL